MTTRLVFGVAALLLLTACPKSGDATPRADAATVTTADAESASAPALDASAPDPMATFDASMPDLTGPDDPRFRRLTLFQQIAVEKANRPSGTVTVEQVFDAIKSKLSEPVTEQRQLAGFPVLAGYCMRGETSPAVDITVCEFRDSASLAKGREVMNKTHTPKRDLLVVKTTTVSVTRYDDKPASAEDAKKIVALVKTLQ